jgi:acyl-CoA thioesterase
VADRRPEQAAGRRAGAGRERAGADREDGSAAEPYASPGAEREADSGALGAFDRDTAVRRLARVGGPAEEGERCSFAAEVSPQWRAGRGPHGGYLAALLLRALSDTVADPARAPRSLTIHFARAPEPGPVAIETVIERRGRSLSTLSARMERDGRLLALALAAFSVPWEGPEIAELAMPAAEPPDSTREAGTLRRWGAPPFTGQIVVQPRIGAPPFSGSSEPMEVGAWLGLAEPRPLDALSVAFFSDALFSAPFMRMTERATTPTVDLTVHFRTTLPRSAAPDPHELCFARFRSSVIHDGFFEEDGTIWAADGTVLAQSRQLAIVMALPNG